MLRLSTTLAISSKERAARTAMRRHDDTPSTGRRPPKIASRQRRRARGAPLPRAHPHPPREGWCRRATSAPPRRGTPIGVRQRQQRDVCSPCPQARNRSPVRHPLAVRLRHRRECRRRSFPDLGTTMPRVGVTAVARSCSCRRARQPRGGATHGVGAPGCRARPHRGRSAAGREWERTRRRRARPGCSGRPRPARAGRGGGVPSCRLRPVAGSQTTAPFSATTASKLAKLTFAACSSSSTRPSRGA